MLASFLITFREALEAALIIGIIAAYLAKLARGKKCQILTHLLLDGLRIIPL